MSFVIKKNPTLKQYHNKIAILQFSNHCVVFFFFLKSFEYFFENTKNPSLFHKWERKSLLVIASIMSSYSNYKNMDTFYAIFKV